MFRQRLLTSIVLIPAVLWVIFYASIGVLSVVVAAIVAMSAWEWTSLIPISRPMNKGLFTLVLLSITWISAHFFHVWLDIGILLWMSIFVAIGTYPSSQHYWGSPWIVGGICLWFLPLFANSLAGIYLQDQGQSKILYLLCLVWAADVGAYLFGKWVGRHKLIPFVSPGKTVEGALGGLFLTLIVAVLAALYFKPQSYLIWYLLAVGINIVSVLGDLTISMLKRRSQLKDTGHLLPGHGGILDRLDSLIAAAPMFYFGLSYLRH